MEISVIIPTYNRRALLQRALRSVRAQTYPATEIIVCDDGSTDGTASMLTSLFPEAMVTTLNRQGVSAARNKGIHSTTCEWVAFLDSDDEWHPEKLEQQVALANENPSAKIIHCEEMWVRNGRPLAQKKYHQKSGGDIFEVSLQRCMISPSAILLKRCLFERYGMFDESLPACEDYDLWLRLTAFEAVDFIAQPLVTKYGGHDDQLSKITWGLDRFRIVALKKLVRDASLSADQRHAAAETLLRKFEIFTNGAKKRGTFTPSAEDQAMLSEVKALLSGTNTSQSSPDA